MDCYAVERHVPWSKRGEVYEFRYEKHGHKYLWRCTEAMRRECLLSVTLDAHNRKLNLSLEDATFIQSRIREVIQPEFSEWIEVEASPIESESLVKLPKTDWLGWVILVSGSFLVLLFSMIVRAWL